MVSMERPRRKRLSWESRCEVLGRNRGWCFSGGGSRCRRNPPILPVLTPRGATPILAPFR
jgi:hypothetical protein